MRFYCSILFAVNSTFYAAVCNYLLLRQNTGRLNEILQRSAISCNKLVVKALTSLQMRCHTTLWYTANTITVGFVDSLTLMSSRPTNSHSRMDAIYFIKLFQQLQLLESIKTTYHFSCSTTLKRFLRFLAIFSCCKSHRQASRYCYSRAQNARKSTWTAVLYSFITSLSDCLAN